MKSVKNVMLLALAVFLFNVSHAQDGMPATRTKMITKITVGQMNQCVEVRLANLCEIPSKIKITNAIGRVFFKESIKNESGYAKAFSLKDLKPGNYKLLIIQGQVERITPITLTRSELLIGETLTLNNGLQATDDHVAIEK